jgi:hypothetical protein
MKDTSKTKERQFFSEWLSFSYKERDLQGRKRYIESNRHLFDIDKAVEENLKSKEYAHSGSKT